MKMGRERKQIGSFGEFACQLARRISFTHWLKNAHARMGTCKYEAQRHREFKMGACAVGDGSSLIDVEVNLFVLLGI